MASTLPIPNPSVKLMEEIGGKPTQHGREFLERLEKIARTLQADKANAATTLAGYGITDAEELGELAGINTQTGNYTLVLTDKGKTIEMNVASANTLTIPPNASVAFPVGSWVNVTQLGAGQTTLTPGSGVTIRGNNAALKLIGQYAMATLYKRGTNEWVAGGNLVP